MSDKTEQTKRPADWRAVGLIHCPLCEGVEKEVSEDRSVGPQDDTGEAGEGHRIVRADGFEPADFSVLITEAEGEGYDKFIVAFKLMESPKDETVFTGEGVGEGEGVGGEHFFGLVGCRSATPTMGTKRIPSTHHFIFHHLFFV
jgi:hypothetical protein